MRTLTYAESGVDEPREQEALARVLHLFKSTYAFRNHGLGKTCADIGHFANVLNLGSGLGLAFTTDGVGTKLLIAEALQRFESAGIDCVANNVNDLICLGAEPIALLDYIATNRIDEAILEDVARGLVEGARRAHISIPGGEIAQVAAMLSQSKGVAMDLVGSAVGVVALDPARKDLTPLVSGERTAPGDVIIGLPSSGLHSNGYSLARKVLLETGRLQLTDVPEGLGKTLADELLTPTAIYVDPVLNLLRTIPDAIHGLVHISGGGLLNLARLPDGVSYLVEHMPPIPQIFRLIQKLSSLPNSQMFSTFNMGVGFAIVAAREAAPKVLDSLEATDTKASIIGQILEKPGGEIRIPQFALSGHGEVFLDLS